MKSKVIISLALIIISSLAIIIAGIYTLPVLGMIGLISFFMSFFLAHFIMTIDFKKLFKRK